MNSETESLNITGIQVNFYVKVQEGIFKYNVKFLNVH